MQCPYNQINPNPYSLPNNLPNPGIAPIPYTQPPAPRPLPGALGFGMDPNPAFTAAINRLAAALGKLSEA